jgi:hypothetical protein
MSMATKKRWGIWCKRFHEWRTWQGVLLSHENATFATKREAMAAKARVNESCDEVREIPAKRKETP